MSNFNWKKCKSHSTSGNWKRLANTALAKIKPILKDKKLSLNIKLRSYNAYVSSVFLYNSETWTLTKTLSNAIDAFHRRHLHGILDIRWPKVISNDDLYETTPESIWSDKITNRRLTSVHTTEFLSLG